ncbi:lysis protein [Dickeya fangzhongdai]|uniref:lysis system i-spanin subunit Rz n=1 Tax=Dickeya fangzhongdai TaxID=1778540 RepID=UPI001371AEFC|nr:lysis system i-spanin subunit Rz [Dickeya fangzhongdai]UMB78857.1 lysis protein [Dickeya fangzhongdai]
MPDWKITGVALAVGALIGAAICWWFTTTSYDADIAILNTKHAETLKVISDQATADSELARQREHDFQAKIAALDEKHQQELNDEKTKNEKLLFDVSTGRRRVQFATAALATCEQSSAAVRSASSLGNAAAIQLSPAAGRNILGIRAGVKEDREKLVYLQEYIRALREQGVVAK